MGNTADITKAARALASAEKKLAKVVGNEEAAVAKATAKAEAKYAVKIKEATEAVSAAKSSLQAIVAAA